MEVMINFSQKIEFSVQKNSLKNSARFLKKNLLTKLHPQKAEVKLLNMVEIEHELEDRKPAKCRLEDNTQTMQSLSLNNYE